MSDDINKKQLQCRERFSAAADQFRELLEKIEAVETPSAPPKKKQKRSEKKQEVLPPPTDESERAAVRELVEAVRGCLSVLGDDVDMADVAGPSRPSVGDK